ETDYALVQYKKGSISSVSAMVFMADSRRAATIAREAAVPAGLHLNLSERFTEKDTPLLLRQRQERIACFLHRNKYALLLYNPLLRSEFRYVYEAQLEEFCKLYNRPPTHVDGHRHFHLCTNMLLDKIYPAGSAIRRNFSFFQGEKNVMNILYRRTV